MKSVLLSTYHLCPHFSQITYLICCSANPPMKAEEEDLPRISSMREVYFHSLETRELGNYSFMKQVK